MSIDKKFAAITFGFIVACLVILGIVLNGMLLTFIFYISFALLSIGGWLFNLQHLFTSTTFLVLISYTLIILSVFGGLTHHGERLIRLFLNTRELLPHEKELLSPLLPLVNTTDTTQPIILLVGGQGFHNLTIFGHNTIIISDNLLNDLLLNTSILNESEISVLFMREIGALQSKYGLIILGFWYSNITTILSGKLLHQYYQLQLNLSQLIRHAIFRGLIVISMLCGTITLLLSPIIILQWISNKFMNLATLYIKKYAAYTADKFVVSQGYQEELIAILSKSEIMSPTNLTSEFKQIFLPQISNVQRVKRLNI